MRYVLFLLVPFCLFADTGASADIPAGPWLTGPIVTTSAYTIPKGHFNIEPYLYVMENIGAYGSRGHVHKNTRIPEAVNIVILIQIGLTDSIDLNIYPQLNYQYNVGKDHIGVGDIVIGPSYQLIRQDKDDYGFTWKVGFNQVFPSGSFENLDPTFLGNDGSGGGVWATGLYTALAKLIHLEQEHYLRLRSAFTVNFFVPKKVHGENIYGGDATTNGYLARGVSVFLDLAFELTLTKNWALALDMENMYQTGSKFQGSTVLPVGNPKDSYILSFAPALEYNFSSDLGIIAGCWFSAYGLNTKAFQNVVIAVNWSQ